MVEHLPRMSKAPESFSSIRKQGVFHIFIYYTVFPVDKLPRLFLPLE